MRVDIVELRQFYSSFLGKCTTDAISKVLSTTWDDVTGCRLLGLGYAIPFFSCFHGKVERTLAFMPAGQGATNWPDQYFSSTALVSEGNLPLADSSVDCVLMVHYLEFAEDPFLMLHEIWRVLTSGGRMIVVVPNKRGMWARMEHTPFGSGQPYSWYQMISLLREANFTLSITSRSLFFPPTHKKCILKLWSVFEKIGNIFGPGFAGIYVIEARKILYQGLPITESKKKHISSPILVPHTVST
ncbi:methyltransferase domain-containing protein [Candidatus Liberibacter asiaticus]|uniref:Methyltransferase type 11 n=3 Tax=Liberibacter asiaticus TaxID=34021 RepID=C6XFA2_LIBAP|nr:methyltransferase domain-containing protein [Candidatus Liberibacter asiaticus]ACT57055.1 Methyltransferase type 11 [Candidatus Liberibacter asiaticus str. psy62]AGH16980.1 type 11 methyltransferase [Candidatus Liberibacter asiaticus str. gxpsy]ALK07316.1 methyltransferase domain-containing protein [Candidatus Liberibacter asiaticus]ASK52807.1 SAM-dependent methyltransferase [Candidatus Liberibacter asiaticus]AWL14124.1 class I SAM-dependent methyltransferase [Candidatus Liberibacter asiati